MLYQIRKKGCIYRVFLAGIFIFEGRGIISSVCCRLEGVVGNFTAYVLCFTVTCRTTDWCLKQSSNDDFDWSFGTSCTKTEETGPCNDAVFNNEGKFLCIRQAIFL